MRPLPVVPFAALACACACALAACFALPDYKEGGRLEQLPQATDAAVPDAATPVDDGSVDAPGDNYVASPVDAATDAGGDR